MYMMNTFVLLSVCFEKEFLRGLINRISGIQKPVILFHLSLTKISKQDLFHYFLYCMYTTSGSVSIKH